MMKHTRFLLSVAVAAAVSACSNESTSPTTTNLVPKSNVSATGNGAPSGAHYNLNIIGVDKGKTADLTGDNGHRIFVPLYGKSVINLTEGDFGVLDANGTDGSPAAFQLPNPDPDGDGTTSYSVYVRALGKPGGKAIMQSCYTDTTGTWCAADFAGGVNPITIERTKGKQTFVNVSKDLLYVDYCTAFDSITGACTSVTQVPLFGVETASYFWDYDNTGLKLAQLRFYEIPTVTGF
jgi:hypothetical protein